MSKNTGNAKFRKIDVDQYNEDAYQDEQQSDDSPQLAQGPNENEVQSLLQQGDNKSALRIVLDSAPITSKNQQVKEKALQLTLRVVLAFKSSEVEEAINALSDPQLDMLMKYIYKGFENPSEGSSALLLTWHEKAFAKGGIGSIVRVLTDRKRV